MKWWHRRTASNSLGHMVTTLAEAESLGLTAAYYQAARHRYLDVCQVHEVALSTQGTLVCAQCRIAWPCEPRFEADVALLTAMGDLPVR